MKEDLPYEAAPYAADHDLLREKAFAKWAPYVLRKANRWSREVAEEEQPLQVWRRDSMECRARPEA